MTGLLEGKRVVMTGATANIGKAAASSFAHAGARLVVADVDPACEATAAELRDSGFDVTFQRTDVSSPEDWERLYETAAVVLGGVDVIVSHAGIQRSGLVENFSAEDWDLTMGVNLRSCFLAAKYGIEHLRAAGGGVIINTASVAGLSGAAGMSAYAASKAGIVGFSRSLAAELGPEGIRVHALCPGWIDTTFNAPVIERIGGEDALADALQAVPLRRQGTPDEVANTMLFLASDMSSYITGQSIIVDGGLY